MKRSQGFTLIEIAIVLIIITLISGGLISFFNIQLTNQRITTTKANEVAIKVALTNFIARNNRLPCPAIPTTAPSAVGYGREAPAVGGACTGLTPNGTVVTGIVPWISLGISSDAASDGYYNRFTYQVVLTATSTKLTPQTVSGISGTISLHSSGPGVLGTPPTGNQINDCGNTGTGQPNPCAAVAILVSHGRNGYGAYSDQGIQQSAAIGPDEQENTNGDSRFVVKDFSDSPTNPFDDIVLALTPNDLLTQLVQGGVLKDARGVLNDDFETVKTAIVSYAISNRSGSPYSYPLPTSPLSPATTDPWGQTIQYQVITTPISTSSLPGNAFKLMSAGPDGVLGTSDDIVVTISIDQALALIARLS